jgi:hypothetical protein
VLSQLDKELCSRSFLSIVASQEIDSYLWQAWDIDHDSNNLLLEARPSWAADKTLNSLVCYPQITFEPHGPDIRGDCNEMTQFGLNSLKLQTNISSVSVELVRKKVPGSRRQRAPD